MLTRLWVPLVMCICIMCVPSRSFAEEEDLARLLERAKAFASENRFDEAISAWLSALDRLSGSELATVRKKLGLTCQQTNRLPEAWHFLSLYLSSPDGRDDSMVRGWSQEVEDSLKQTHVKIRISCHPEGASIKLPTIESPAGPISRRCPITWWFLPGAHDIRLEAGGFLSRKFEVDVLPRDDPGARKLVLVPPAPKPSRALEWSLIGSGLALGAAGGVLNVMAWSKNKDLRAKYDTEATYDDARRRQVRPMAIAAYTLYGVAGAAALAGIITWAARTPGGSTEGPTGVTVSPMIMPGGTGALMTFDF